MSSSSYSYRSATIGSTDEARRAGIALASSVIRAIPAKAATNEIGSPGETLNSMERSRRDAATASGSPTATPTRVTMSSGGQAIEMPTAIANQQLTQTLHLDSLQRSHCSNLESWVS